MGLPPSCRGGLGSARTLGAVREQRHDGHDSPLFAAGRGAEIVVGRAPDGVALVDAVHAGTGGETNRTVP